jgi:hypothetical protein
LRSPSGSFKIDQPLHRYRLVDRWRSWSGKLGVIVVVDICLLDLTSWLISYVQLITSWTPVSFI